MLLAWLLIIAAFALFAVTVCRRSRLVRLHLPANGVDRDLHVGGTSSPKAAAISASSSIRRRWSVNKVCAKPSEARHVAWLCIVSPA